VQDYTAIKDVVSICRSAEQGFRGAANSVKSPLLKSLFEEYSVQRGEFAQELRQAAREMGMDVEDSSGLGGMLHAGWMELKAALTKHDEHRILEETERGEDLSLRTYRESLGLNLSEQVRVILERQLGEVQAAHNRIRSLRDTLAKETHPSERTGSPPTV
jgi:uncharacterized protein (TIGR02284 family)